MSTPLKYDGDLREFSTANLERLSYLLRVAYADHLNNRGTASGRVFVGSSGGTAIGSLADHKSTQQTNTRTRNYSNGEDWPSYPGIGTTTVATYNYRQYRTTVTAPSNSTLDNSSYMYIYNTSHIRVAGSSQLISSVVDDAITQLRSGDQVGTYRISTSTPTNGGAGSWTNLGTWFQNTTYSAGTTTYNLWLKRSLNTVPGTAANPLKLRSDNHLQEQSLSVSGDLIQNVLLPIMINRGLSETTLLRYVVASSLPSGAVNKGSFSDTKQTGVSNSEYFSNPTYVRTSTPSGSPVNDGTAFFYIQ